MVIMIIVLTFVFTKLRGLNTKIKLDCSKLYLKNGLGFILFITDKIYH